MNIEVPNFPYSKIVIPVVASLVGLAVLARGAYSFFIHSRVGRGITRRTLLGQFEKFPNPLPLSVPFASRVQPHSKIEKIAENLWIVKGSMPGSQFPPEFLRVMVIYRFPNSNSLLLFSCLCMDEGGLKELDELGKVEYIYVPCSWHTLDASAYKGRYPNAKIVGPRKCISRVEGKTVIEEAAENLFSFFHESNETGPGNEVTKYIRLIAPEGVSDAFDEYSLLVDLPGNKKAVILNDMLVNIPKLDKEKNVVGHDVGVGIVVRILMIESEKIYRSWFKRVFLEQILAKDVEIITLSHGAPIIGREKVLKYVSDSFKTI